MWLSVKRKKKVAPLWGVLAAFGVFVLASSASVRAAGELTVTTVNTPNHPVASVAPGSGDAGRDSATIPGGRLPTQPSAMLAASTGVATYLACALLLLPAGLCMCRFIRK